MIAAAARSCVFGLLLLLGLGAVAAQEVRIGVLAYRSLPQVQAQWDPLARALDRAIAGKKFVIEVSSFQDMTANVASRQLDFILTNPGHYVLMANRSGLSAPLATLSALEQGIPVTSFGGVIFRRADRADIHGLQDLRGKSVAVTSADSLGGYQMQAYELAQVGMHLPHDVRVVNTGMPHDNVVDTVMQGRADAGFVRSGVLESLSAEGKLDLTQLAIVNPQDLPGFPARVSTRLYPEWVFAAMPHSDRDLSRKVVSFLLNMEQDQTLTHALGVHGFDVPSDYSGVEQVMRELRVPPFDVAPDFSATDVWERFRWGILSGLGAASLLLLLGLRLLLVNLRLKEQRDTVRRQTQSLQESELRFRTVANYTHDWEYWQGADQQILYMSPSCQRVTGYRSEEFVADPGLLERIVHPDDLHLMAAHLHQADGLCGDEPVEFRILRRDASVRWISHVCQAVYDDDGHYNGRRVANRDVTERKLADEEKRVSEEQLMSFYESDLVGLTVTSPDKGWIRINHYLCRMLAYSEAELRLMTWAQLTHPDDLAADEAQFSRLLANEIDGYSLEKRFISRSGRVIPTELVVRCIRKPDGSVDYITAMIEDISKRKQAEDELRIAATAFESQEGMMVTDANNVILRVNREFTEITGYQPEEAIGRTPSLLGSGAHSAAYFAEMWTAINETGAWVGEMMNRLKNGEVHPHHVTVTAVKDRNGQITNYVAALTDITLRKAAEQQIEALAFYDPLTGLPNRRLLLDRIRQAIAAMARSGERGALLFLDLDHFKTVNDTLGHALGDLLLKQVAKRLSTSVREGDTVSRLGGDEFVLMLEGLSEEALDAAAQAEAIANKILLALDEPHQLGQHERHSSASIGIILFHGRKQNEEDLLKHADIAMFQAKKAGRNTLRFFDPEMQASIAERASLEAQLRKALERDEFELHYQIQVDASLRPFGAEALIRWRHPQRGLLSPLLFIPLAEETGLILPIGQWVIEAACAQLKLWQQDARARDLILAVNVSAKQFHQPGFAAQVQTALTHYAINPQRLKLELTESMLQDNLESTIATMHALRQAGIRFSLDDFGTGYSSLQYLKRLPLDQLKIDRSFVRDIVSDAHDRSIVRTIIAMARSLDLDVIAEGVETEEQRQLLLDKGCSYFQGYLISKPVPVDEFEALLDQAAGT